MKRIISLLLLLSIFAGSVFAQEDDGPDIYEDDYEYLQNGPGDQFLKIELGALFPLNFGNKLWPGVQATIGYYRFVTPLIALGGEISVSSQFSIGNKALFMVPITFGAMFQPTYNKFEFPIFLTMGIVDHTWANATYFPTFTLKGEAGAYYRITEAWSFGLSTYLMWSIEKSKGEITHGLFETASITARYHF